MPARYVHTNLVARDFHKLVSFYQHVFGCTAAVTEQVLTGEWLDQATGIPDAQMRLTHLRLPGHGDQGPTLEIVQYRNAGRAQIPAANRPGYGHLAFVVEDVEAALAAVAAAGGGSVGEIATAELPGRGRLTFVYATDPEGNIVELQRWD